jgi:hypothetical protein
MGARFAITFAGLGDFEATRAAEKALGARGFAIGPMQRGAPRAVMFGDYQVAKWRNLSRDERRETHASLTGDGRNGPLIFRLLSAAPDDACRAFELVGRDQATIPPVSPSTFSDGLGGVK